MCLFVIALIAARPLIKRYNKKTAVQQPTQKEGKSKVNIALIVAFFLNNPPGGSLNNLFIQFNGIKVSDKNKNLVKNYSQSIFQLSPSDSIVTFNFLNSSAGFFAGVSIVSQTKTFEEECTENSLETAMRTLHKKIKKQLSDWKSKRFDIA